MKRKKTCLSRSPLAPSDCRRELSSSCLPCSLRAALTFRQTSGRNLLVSSSRALSRGHPSTRVGRACHSTLKVPWCAFHVEALLESTNLMTLNARSRSDLLSFLTTTLQRTVCAPKPFSFLHTPRLRPAAFVRSSAFPRRRLTVYSALLRAMAQGRQSTLKYA